MSELRVIVPERGWASVDLPELWRSRELLYVLARRNVLVRYKQTVFGIGWAVIQPLVLMIVFTLVFGRLAGLSSKTGGIPYPVFNYAALLPWLFFATSITQASGSLVANSQLLTKVYFPRLVLPLSNVLAALVDFAIAFVILLVLEAAYGLHPRPQALFAIPLLLLLAAAAALGAGLWFAALNVSYRDVQYFVPFLMQIWFFLTPVVYSTSTIVSQAWQIVYALNPMVGVVNGFRWALIDAPGTSSGLNPWAMVVSVTVAISLLLTGAFFFRRTERGFADVV